ncbi:MAG: glycosyl hydrolase family 28-related protein [bacterium]|nr:glycosyl hydrolase family 28-related protein [bacterium]
MSGNSLAGDSSMFSAMGFFDPRRFGAVGDGQADDTPAFQVVLAEIGTARGTLVLARGAFRLNTLTIPENVDLQFVNGGCIVIPEGQTLRVLGGIDAPPVAIFDGAVEGKPRVNAVYPQWFGAKGDGKADDASALQQAADFARESFGRLLFIPGGRYLFASSLAIRCNVECRGTLVKHIVLDASRHVARDPQGFLPRHYTQNSVVVSVVDDQAVQALDPAPFYGIQENSFKLPAYRDISLVDTPDQCIDLEEGGTIVISSTDFFTSRNNNRGDEWYDRNDCSQLVSPLGDVYPEFAFDYPSLSEAPEWNPDTVYSKGDYCCVDGVLYKATWPSGAGTSYEHRYSGKVEVGSHSPAEGGAYGFTYADGTEDQLTLWREVGMTVSYAPPQRPLTINGLEIEVGSAEPLDGPHLVSDGGTVSITRSNVTLNNLRVSCVDRNCLISSLCSISRCCNVTFNQARVSGATYNGLGYNLLHSNCANITYNNCVSINCRDALAGRHGKNILVDGGHYNRVDDHYGRNITVRNAEIHAISTMIPGYMTPEVDLSGWGFIPSVAFVFGGCNFRMESCRIVGCSSVFSGRGDTADLYGTITLRDITIEAEGDVSLFTHSFSPDFDFAHRVRVPDRLMIENVTLTGPGHFRLNACGSSDSPYGAVLVRNCNAIGEVQGKEVEYTFEACSMANTRFNSQDNVRCNFRNCEFSGELTGMDAVGIGFASGNLVLKGATVPFPLESISGTVYDVK